MIESVVLEDFPNLARKYKKFVIGLSGGQDSVAILHALKELKSTDIENSNFLVEAVHVNHGLQKHATEFQQFCQGLCSKLQIKLHIEYITKDEEGKKELGIEAFARRERYLAYSRILNAEDCLVLGHHAEDQVETFLLQWIRGSGINGLSCMTRFTQKTVRGKRFSVWRPFLHLTKDSIKRYLVDNRLNWVDDPTNLCNKFDRNKIRNVILPEILSIRKGGMKGMLRSIDNVREAKHLIDRKMKQLFRNVVYSDCDFLMQNEFLNVTICGIKLLKESDSVICELIRFWLSCAGLIAPPSTRLKEFVRQLRRAARAARPELIIKGEIDSYKMLSFKGRLWLEKK